MSFQIRWGNRWVYKKFSGAVTADEFALSLKKTQSDPRFNDLAYAINDFSDVEAALVSGDDVRRFVALGLGAVLSNPELQTVVLTRNPELAALVTHFAKGSLIAVHVFASVAEVQAWMPEPYRDQIPW